jgi:hypothetical protein
MGFPMMPSPMNPIFMVLAFCRDWRAADDRIPRLWQGSADELQPRCRAMCDLPAVSQTLAEEGSASCPSKKMIIAR